MPDPLYHVIPHFLRICKITLVTDPSGGKFAKCTCGEREGVGVPCNGVFKICDDAGVPDQDMVHPCMVDVRYLKLYHTHYGKEGDIAELLLTAQKEGFLNKGKETEITTELMHLLRSTVDDTVYPLIGKNTTEDDLVEAMFAMERSTTTVMDIERVRQSDSTEDYQD